VSSIRGRSRTPTGGSAAAVAAARGRRKLSQCHRAIEDVAFALASFEHVRRTRELTVRVAAELPSPDHPGASALLGEACRDVELDLDAARTAAAAFLIAYAAEVVRGAA
jgi:hypothetical protein